MKNLNTLLKVALSAIPVISNLLRLKTYELNYLFGEKFVSVGQIKAVGYKQAFKKFAKLYPVFIKEGHFYITEKEV